MLGPLLYLSALIALTAAANSESREIPQNVVIDISECILPFYGIPYDKLSVRNDGRPFGIYLGGSNTSGVTEGFIITPPPARVYLSMRVPPEDFHPAMPTITNSMRCSICFEMQMPDGQRVNFDLFSSDPFQEAVAQLTSAIPMFVMAMVEGTPVYTMSASVSDPVALADISGCRYRGAIIPAGEDRYFPETCTNAECRMNRTLTTVGCDQGHCHGNGRCVEHSICSVVGHAVIDMHNRNSHVRDRCAYSLIDCSHMRIEAVFNDEHVESVMIILHRTHTVITMNPDGTVTHDGSVVSFTQPEVHIDGVTLTMNSGGVLATTSLYGYHICVLIDCILAQIHMEVPVGFGLGHSLTGLCVDAESWDTARVPCESRPGCDHLDHTHDTIDCTTDTHRCDIMRDSYFSDCHPHWNPDYYIDACRHTCSRSPADLWCPFAHAYARGCSLMQHVLDGWHVTSCPRLETICQNTFCSDHEFHDVNDHGEMTCYCKDSFAQSYRLTNTLADPVVCTPYFGSISLPLCLLEEKWIDYTQLSLIDETCTGHLDPIDHRIHFNFSSSHPCGAEFTINDDHSITISNRIRTTNSHPDIARVPDVNIAFSCVYHVPAAVTMAFTISGSSVFQHITPGESTCNVILTAYTNEECTHVVDSNTHLKLDQKVCIMVTSEGICNQFIDLRIDACWVTPQPNPESSPRYDLIHGGCENPADRTVEVMRGGAWAHHGFFFNLFKFIEYSNEIFLHCSVKPCHRDSDCTPDCLTPRRRRSVQPEFEP